MSLGTTYSPAVPMGGAASHKLWPVFIYSDGYWEVYRRFQFFFCLGGDLRGVMWENISMEKLIMGEENFNEGGAGFSSIIWKNNEKISMKSFFLRISLTNENVCKKLKVVVAFLSNQKIGGQLGLLLRFFFFKISRLIAIN